jgi:N-acetylglutamate synthase-like GNAT family acetyltransferase
MSEELEIRVASPADAELIAEILTKAFTEFERDYTPEALEYVTPRAGEIRGRFAEGPIWLALVNGNAVGTVSVVREPEWLYIRSMAVLPAAQGHGAGGALLKAVEEYAFETDVQTLFLYTTHFSRDAIRLYERHGFIRGRETTAEEWCGTPGFEMWKYLNKDVRTGAPGS